MVVIPPGSCLVLLGPFLLRVAKVPGMAHYYLRQGLHVSRRGRSAASPALAGKKPLSAQSWHRALGGLWLGEPVPKEGCPGGSRHASVYPERPVLSSEAHALWSAGGPSSQRWMGFPTSKVQPANPQVSIRSLKCVWLKT